MPQVTRSFDTDLAELAYQIQRSEAFFRLEEGLRAGAFDEQEAQEKLLDLIDAGHCRLEGDRGWEQWSWALNEREAASLALTLFRNGLGGD